MADEEKQDRRGAAKGEWGNKPHERSEEAATLIKELSSYGMPHEEISRVLNATFGGGFSVDTITRHYPAEVEAAMAEKKGELLRKLHEVALGKKVPEGVTPDTAYRESISSLKWALGAVHRVRDGMEHDFGAGTINVTISGDDAEL